MVPAERGTCSASRNAQSRFGIKANSIESDYENALTDITARLLCPDRGEEPRVNLQSVNSIKFSCYERPQLQSISVPVDHDDLV